MPCTLSFSEVASLSLSLFASRALCVVRFPFARKRITRQLVVASQKRNEQKKSRTERKEATAATVHSLWSRKHKHKVPEKRPVSRILLADFSSNEKAVQRRSKHAQTAIGGLFLLLSVKREQKRGFFRLFLNKNKTRSRSRQNALRTKKTITFSFCLQNTIEIWLILPVVICLFQGLSHACLRITALQESAHGSLHQTQSAAKMLRKRIIGYLVRNAKLIHELVGTSRPTRPEASAETAWWVSLRMNESTNQRPARGSITEKC